MPGLQLIQSLFTAYSTARAVGFSLVYISREYNQDKTFHLLHMEKKTGQYQGFLHNLVKTVEGFLPLERPSNQQCGLLAIHI